MDQQPTSQSNRQKTKPYVTVGAGRMTAAIWKTGGEEHGWHYRFTMFRIDEQTGAIGQQFEPADVLDLCKLTQVLASTLVDDGRLTEGLRQELGRLAKRLDLITGEEISEMGEADYVRAPRQSLAQVLRHLWQHEKVFLEARENGSEGAFSLDDILALSASLGR